MPRRPRVGVGPPARVFVDRGAFIALVSANDRHHEAAEAMFRDAVARSVRLFTTNLVVAEVHRVVLSRAGIRAATTVLDRMEASRSLEIRFVDVLDHRAARVWLEKLDDHAITYTDAASFAVMTATNCSHAMSFDEDFSVAGFTRWVDIASFAGPRG